MIEELTAEIGEISERRGNEPQPYHFILLVGNLMIQIVFAVLRCHSREEFNRIGQFTRLQTLNLQISNAAALISSRRCAMY